MSKKMFLVKSFLVKSFLFAVVLFGIVNVGYSATLDTLENKYPTIKSQATILENTGFITDIDDNAKILNSYLGSLKSVEAKQGMDMILLADYVNANSIKKNNYSLGVLLKLMEKGIYMEGDSITLAFAIANNYIFDCADNETRTEIMKDIAKHLKFYKKVVKWQKSEKLPYHLDQVPLITKVFWADRTRYYNYNIRNAKGLFNEKEVTLKIYNEFVDKIETLETIHKIVVKEGLAKTSLSATAADIEEYIRQNRVYRSSMENLKLYVSCKIFSEEQMKQATKEYKNGEYYKFYFGKKRRWDEFRWLNYQQNLFKEKGHYKGDCGDTTVVQMGYYKAAGIATLSMQRGSKSGSATAAHNFPAHYNPMFKRWNIYQKDFVIHKKGGIPIKNIEGFGLLFNKPIWHHFAWLENIRKYKQVGNVQHYIYYPGEYKNLQDVYSLLKLGMSPKHLEKIFLGNKTQTPGLFFNDKTAPAKIVDSDGDGLADILEADYGVNKNKWDSDGDGYSDYWEMDSGYNPKSISSPGKNSKIIALDGFADDIQNKNSKAVHKDPKGDSKGGKKSYDVGNFYAHTIDNILYLGVKFHNKTFDKDCKRHEMHIITVGKKEREYWLSGAWDSVGGKNYLRGGSLSQKIGDKWEKVEHNGNMKVAFSRDVEFAIHTKYLNNPNEIRIRYYVKIADGKAGISDETEYFSVVINPDTDGDYLCDSDEKKHRTDKNNWDSDGDGYSDGWEIEKNYDPLSAKSPKNNSLYVLDGFVPESKIKQMEATTIYDAKGDNKAIRNIYDIKSLSARVLGDSLYLGATYHNNTLKNRIWVNSFMVTIKNQPKKKYWVQWYDIYFSISDANSKTWDKITSDSTGFSRVIARDAEFVFLLSFFKGADVLYIDYRAGGFEKGKKKISTSADSIAPVRIPLTKDDFSYKVPQLIEKALGVEDAQNDFVAVKHIYDIKSFKVLGDTKQIFCYVDFHNDTKYNDFTAHTIKIRNPETKQNWWIQWWNYNAMGVHYWKDGTKSVKLDINTKDFEFIRYGNGFAISIPRLILSLGYKKYEIVYYAGGYDGKGKNNYKSDETEKVVIEGR